VYSIPNAKNIPELPPITARVSNATHAHMEMTRTPMYLYLYAYAASYFDAGRMGFSGLYALALIFWNADLALRTETLSGHLRRPCFWVYVFSGCGESIETKPVFYGLWSIPCRDGIETQNSQARRVVTWLGLDFGSNSTTYESSRVLDLSLFFDQAKRATRLDC
jgi:hypothetical protein